MLDQLNPAQQEAVCWNRGPMLVLAGAGSGKTRVITYKIAWLVREVGVPEHQILAVTFTNKAAAEMKQRATVLLDRPVIGATISTFHSLCLRILRKEAVLLGYGPDFSICDPSDAQTMIKDALERVGRKRDKAYAPKKVQAMLSRIKNGSAGEGEIQKLSDIEQILELYDRALKDQNLMDFDDLLLNARTILAQFPDTATHYRDRFRYILVDEFQDTNRVQYELIQMLGGTAEHLCAVGDEDQSIYGWRGADFENILRFPEDFPDTRLIKLERNYRSTRAILEIANAVIAHNTLRHPKKLVSDNDREGERVVLEAADAREEAGFVTRQLRSLAQQGIPFREMVVLYRANHLSRSMEDALRRENIPYRIVGGYKFYERKEIKDILGYLKVLRNPADNPSFQRIVNVPRRKVGPATLKKLAAIDPIYTRALTRLPESFPRYRELSELMAVLNRFRQRQDFGPDFLQDLLADIGYVEMIRAEEESIEAESRLENIQELVQVVGDYVRMSPEPSLAGFLDEVSLLSDTDEMSDEDAVNLMTIHCAKGLEFDAVFVIGLEEGTFPNQRTMGSQKELEEERRLMYVAVTRARRNLYLTCARNRGWGLETTRKRVSRFLREIPDHLVRVSGFTGGLGSGLLAASHRRPVYKTQSASSPTSNCFKKGDAVFHQTYGDGTVLNIVNADRLVVKFKRTGIKVLRTSAVQARES